MCPEMYKFSSHDRTFSITLTKEQLDKYPDCLFSILINHHLDGDKITENEYKTQLTPKTLEAVVYFFEKGKWQNPYLSGMRTFQINGETYNFDQVVEFLNLPANEIDWEDDEAFYESEDEDDYLINKHLNMTPPESEEEEYEPPDLIPYHGNWYDRNEDELY